MNGDEEGKSANFKDKVVKEFYAWERRRGEENESKIEGEGSFSPSWPSHTQLKSGPDPWGLFGICQYPLGGRNG